MKSFYEQYEVPAAFVGHPLAKQLPLENPIQIAKQELGVDETQKHIALLPGSRKGEVERLLPMLLGQPIFCIQNIQIFNFNTGN